MFGRRTRTAEFVCEDVLWHEVDGCFQERILVAILPLVSYHELRDLPSFSSCYAFLLAFPALTAALERVFGLCCYVSHPDRLQCVFGRLSIYAGRSGLPGYASDKKYLLDDDCWAFLLCSAVFLSLLLVDAVVADVVAVLLFSLLLLCLL